MLAKDRDRARNRWILEICLGGQIGLGILGEIPLGDWGCERLEGPPE